MSTTNAQCERPETTGGVDGRKPWTTPCVILADTDQTEKLFGYGDYVYSGNTYGNS